MQPADAEQRQDLVRFVRETLGCQCPDEVFQRIDLAPAGGAQGTPPYRRLLIGERLLIYIAAVGSGGDAAARARYLARLGITERNRSGYNRFRLVLTGAHDREAAASMTAAFAAAVGTDDRAHVHLVALDELPAALGPGVSPARRT